MVRSLIVDGASYGVEKQEWVCRATLTVAKAKGAGCGMESVCDGVGWSEFGMV